MVVHTGFVPLMYHKEWHLEKSKVFWKRFLENKAEDFELYIENVFEDEPYLMKDLIDLIDDKRASICLDVGHANAMTTKEHTVEDWIEILGKRVKHIHIHNNDGTGDTHNSINHGSMDWKRVLEILDTHAAKGYTVTVESRQAEESVKLLLESR
jgi:sugar phosphate isomerase/epimerase